MAAMNSTSSPSAPAAPALLRKQTYAWAVAALILAGLTAAAKGLWGNVPTLWVGLPATAYAAYVFFWSRFYPRIYLGKALLALAVSGAVTYVAFGELAHAHMWRRTFQLSWELVPFRDPQGWSVSHPKLWSHEEQRVSGTTNHVFKPSKITPAMYFSVTSRPNVGTTDLNLVVDGFFQNLPKSREIQIHEKTPLTLPTGQPAYRLLYSELSQRIPLKSETLFVLDKSRLYFLTVSAAPLWFDRHRDYLERLLGTLTLPPS